MTEIRNNLALGKFLILERTKRNFSQSEFANLLELSQSTVSRLEHGRGKIDSYVMRHIEDHLGLNKNVVVDLAAPQVQKYFFDDMFGKMVFMTLIAVFFELAFCTLITFNMPLISIMVSLTLLLIELGLTKTVKNIEVRYHIYAICITITVLNSLVSIAVMIGSVNFWFYLSHSNKISFFCFVPILVFSLSSLISKFSKRILLTIIFIISLIACSLLSQIKNYVIFENFYVIPLLIVILILAYETLTYSLFKHRRLMSLLLLSLLVTLLLSKAVPTRIMFFTSLSILSLSFISIITILLISSYFRHLIPFHFEQAQAFIIIPLILFVSSFYSMKNGFYNGGILVISVAIILTLILQGMITLLYHRLDTKQRRCIYDEEKKAASAAHRLVSRCFRSYTDRAKKE